MVWINLNKIYDNWFIFLIRTLLINFVFNLIFFYSSLAVAYERFTKWVYLVMKMYLHQCMCKEVKEKNKIKSEEEEEKLKFMFCYAKKNETCCMLMSSCKNESERMKQNLLCVDKSLLNHSELLISSIIHTFCFSSW